MNALPHAPSDSRTLNATPRDRERRRDATSEGGVPRSQGCLASLVSFSHRIAVKDTRQTHSPCSFSTMARGTANSTNILNVLPAATAPALP